MSAASPVDITIGGKRIQRGYRVYPVGVDIAKSELYGYLRIKKDGTEAPAGYCHFPEYDGEFFQQLTAEHLVTSTNARTGREVQTWHAMPNRPNHYLDCRVYARAAAYVLGLDKYKAPGAKAPRPPDEPTSGNPFAIVETKREWLKPRRGSWLK